MLYKINWNDLKWSGIPTSSNFYSSYTSNCCDCTSTLLRMLLESPKIISRLKFKSLKWLFWEL